MPVNDQFLQTCSVFVFKSLMLPEAGECASYNPEYDLCIYPDFFLKGRLWIQYTGKMMAHATKVVLNFTIWIHQFAGGLMGTFVP